MFSKIKSVLTGAGKNIPSLRGVVEAVLGHGLWEKLENMLGEKGDEIIKTLLFPEPPPRNLLLYYIHKINDRNIQNALIEMLNIAADDIHKTPTENDTVKGLGGIVDLRLHKIEFSNAKGETETKEIGKLTDDEIVKLLQELGEIALKSEGKQTAENRQFWGRINILINDVHKQRFQVFSTYLKEKYRTIKKFLSKKELRIFKRFFNKEKDVYSYFTKIGNRLESMLSKIEERGKRNLLDPTFAGSLKRLRNKKRNKQETNPRLRKNLLKTLFILVLALVAYLGYFVLEDFFTNTLGGYWLEFNSTYYLLLLGLIIACFIYWVMADMGLASIHNGLYKKSANIDKELMTEVEDLIKLVKEKLPRIQKWVRITNLDEKTGESIPVNDQEISRTKILLKNTGVVSLDTAAAFIAKIMSILQILFIAIALTLTAIIIGVSLQVYLIVAIILIFGTPVLFIGTQLYDIVVSAFRRWKFRRSTRLPSLVMFFWLNLLALVFIWATHLNFPLYLTLSSTFSWYVLALLLLSGIGTYFLRKEITNDITRFFSKVTNRAGVLLLSSAGLFFAVGLYGIYINNFQFGRETANEVSNNINNPSVYMGYIKSPTDFFIFANQEPFGQKELSTNKEYIFRIKTLSTNQKIYFPDYYNDRRTIDGVEYIKIKLMNENEGWVNIKNTGEGEPPEIANNNSGAVGETNGNSNKGSDTTLVSKQQIEKTTDENRAKLTLLTKRETYKVTEDGWVDIPYYVIPGRSLTIETVSGRRFKYLSTKDGEFTLMSGRVIDQNIEGPHVVKKLTSGPEVFILTPI